MASRNKRIKKIVVLTGSRAEYGLLRPVMKALNTSTQFELLTVVCGMHLSSEFGNTLKEIENDGFIISAKINSISKSDSCKDMAYYLGKIVIDTSKVLQTLNPDLVLLLGDRVDALGFALTAAYMNILIAHIHGGDVSNAGLDEPARHSISKFAHIHFAATKKSAARLVKMGEESKRIFIVGAPGLESILNNEVLDSKSLVEKYGIDLESPLILVIQHPVTTRPSDAGKQIKETLLALKSLRYQTVLIYPNADAGGRQMIKVIQQFEKEDFLNTYKSIPHRDYLGLMKISNVLVGNSSSGVIEATSFKLPVVNIGIRQKGRERGTNVVDVAHNRDDIKNVINKILNNKVYRSKIKKCKSPYGDGNTSRKILSILKTIKISKELLQKRITY